MTDMDAILFQQTNAPTAENQIEASLRLAPVFEGVEVGDASKQNRQEPLVCFSMEKKAEKGIVGAALLQRGRQDIISFSVVGKKGELFSLCATVSGQERVLCGRFDEEGRASLSFPIGAQKTRRWRLESPALYEVTAAILGEEQKRAFFLLGRAAYSRRRFKDGHFLMDGERTLPLLGLFVKPPLAPSLADAKRAGVSMLLYPTEDITETLLQEADCLGIGISAVCRVEKGDSLAGLLSDMERLAGLKRRHPSLLYALLLYGQAALKRKASVRKSVEALLRYHASSLALLHLEKRENASFYTDLPFAIEEKQAAALVKARYGVEEGVFRAWLYKRLVSAFFVAGAHYLLLPSFMQSKEGLALLCEGGRLGFEKPTYFIRKGTSPLFAARTRGDFEGAAFSYTLEREKRVLFSCKGTVKSEIPPARLPCSACLENGAYLLRLQVRQDGALYEATASLLSHPDGDNKVKTHLRGLPVGECLLGDVPLFIKEEDSFFLLPEKADIPPLLSFISPLARLSFTGEGISMHLQNEKGRCVVGFLHASSCMVNNLALEDFDTKTGEKEAKEADKNDFFENFF